MNGITEKDLKMIQLFDEVPVNYSLFWKKQHKDILESNKNKNSNSKSNSPVEHSHTHTASSEPVVHISESPHNQHNVNEYHDNARASHHLDATVPSRIAEASHNIHTSPDAYNSDGSRMHNSVFRVHTGHRAPLGDSEIGHTMEHIKYNHDHAHHINTHVDANEINTGFDLMINSLKLCMQQGFDHGICESLLPMLEQYTVYESQYEEMKNAHIHFNHRVTDWVQGEPSVIINASKGFMKGYEMISKAYVNLE